MEVFASRALKYVRTGPIAFVIDHRVAWWKWPFLRLFDAQGSKGDKGPLFVGGVSLGGEVHTIARSWRSILSMSSRNGS